MKAPSKVQQQHEEIVNNPQVQLQNFAQEYNELCKKYGVQIVGVIQTVPTNHGTFELTVRLQTTPMPQQTLEA